MDSYEDASYRYNTIESRSNRPLVNRALVKNTREKLTLLGKILIETIEMIYCRYEVTSI
jgi:hypothetical protein